MDILAKLDRQVADAKATLDTLKAEQDACRIRRDALDGKHDNKSFDKFQHEHWLFIDLKHQINTAEIHYDSALRIRDEFLDADPD